VKGAFGIAGCLGALNMNYFAAYATAVVVFFVVDMAWLGVMAPRVYRPALGDILLPGVNLAPAVVFYVLYPAGLIAFAVVPALKDDTVSTALLYGALYGFFTYATYDLTNHATIRNWTLQITIIDISWGTLLAAISAAVSFLVVRRFF
jgi:uncharacterized membrane protein